MKFQTKYDSVYSTRMKLALNSYFKIHTDDLFNSKFIYHNIVITFFNSFSFLISYDIIYSYHLEKP